MRQSCSSSLFTISSSAAKNVPILWHHSPPYKPVLMVELKFANKVSKTRFIGVVTQFPIHKLSLILQQIKTYLHLIYDQCIYVVESLSLRAFEHYRPRHDRKRPRPSVIFISGSVMLIRRDVGSAYILVDRRLRQHLLDFWYPYLLLVKLKAKTKQLRRKL